MTIASYGGGLYVVSRYGSPRTYLGGFGIGSLGANASISGTTLSSSWSKNVYPLVTDRSVLAKAGVPFEYGIRFRCTYNGYNGLMCGKGKNYATFAMQYHPQLDRMFIGVPVDGSWYDFGESGGYYLNGVGLALGEWHTVTMAYDGARVRVVVDGRALLDKPVPSERLTLSGMNYGIGSNFDAGYSFGGDIDLSRTYIRVGGEIAWGMDLPE